MILLQEEMEEKMKLMDIYNARLTERERRRDFCIQRGLTNIKQQQLLDRRWGSAAQAVCQTCILVACMRRLAQQEGVASKRAWRRTCWPILKSI